MTKKEVEKRKRKAVGSLMERRMVEFDGWAACDAADVLDSAITKWRKIIKDGKRNLNRIDRTFEQAKRNHEAAREKAAEALRVAEESLYLLKAVRETLPDHVIKTGGGS